jgi:alpha-galactosidase
VTQPGVVHLRAGGVSLLLDARAGAGGPLPVVLHWGPDLGGDLDGAALSGLADALHPAAAHSAVDRPVPRRLLPVPADGWRLRPGLAGARPDGGGWSPRFLVRSVGVDTGGTRAEVEADDPEAALGLTVTLRLHPSGVLSSARPSGTWGRSRTWSGSWPPPCPCRPGRSSCST